MQIEYETTKFLVSSIPKGECFVHNNHLYISMGDSKAFNVTDAKVEEMESGISVKPVEAKLIVDND